MRSMMKFTSEDCFKIKFIPKKLCHKKERHNIETDEKIRSYADALSAKTVDVCVPEVFAKALCKEFRYFKNSTYSESTRFLPESFPFASL